MTDSVSKTSLVPKTFSEKWLSPAEWYGRQVTQLFSSLPDEGRGLEIGARVGKSLLLLVGIVSFVVIGPMALIGVIAKCLNGEATQKKAGVVQTEKPPSRNKELVVHAVELSPKLTQNNGIIQGSAASSVSKSNLDASIVEQAAKKFEDLQNRFNNLFDFYQNSHPPKETDGEELLRDLERFKQDQREYLQSDAGETIRPQLDRMKEVLSPEKKSIERCNDILHGIFPQPALGNCLFESVLPGLRNMPNLVASVPENHEQFRAEVVAWMTRTLLPQEQQVNNNSDPELLFGLIVQSHLHNQEKEIQSKERQIRDFQNQGQLGPDRNLHREQRIKELTDEIQKLREKMNAMENNREQTINEYLSWIGQNGKYASQAEVYAIAQMYHAKIRVFCRINDRCDYELNHNLGADPDTDKWGTVNILWSLKKDHFDYLEVEPNDRSVQRISPLAGSNPLRPAMPSPSDDLVLPRPKA